MTSWQRFANPALGVEGNQQQKEQMESLWKGFSPSSMRALEKMRLVDTRNSLGQEEFKSAVVALVGHCDGKCFLDKTAAELAKFFNGNNRVVVLFGCQTLAFAELLKEELSKRNLDPIIFWFACMHLELLVLCWWCSHSSFLDADYDGICSAMVQCGEDH